MSENIKGWIVIVAWLALIAIGAKIEKTYWPSTPDEAADYYDRGEHDDGRYDRD